MVCRSGNRVNENHVRFGPCISFPRRGQFIEQQYQAGVTLGASHGFCPHRNVISRAESETISGSLSTVAGLDVEAVNSRPGLVYDAG
jgi:hypothetical protein